MENTYLLYTEKNAGLCSCSISALVNRSIVIALNRVRNRPVDHNHLLATPVVPRANFIRSGNQFGRSQMS